MSEKIELTSKELNKVFWRSYQALGCYSYDKQQGLPYLRAMVPALEKLYPDQDNLINIMQEPVFADAALTIACMWAAAAAVLAIVSILVLRRTHHAYRNI